MEMVISYTVGVTDMRVARAIDLSSESRAELHKLLRRRTTAVNGGTFIRPAAPGSYRFRGVGNVIFETGNNFSISPVLLCQATGRHAALVLRRCPAAGPLQ
jgi:hypothetical protein